MYDLAAIEAIASDETAITIALSPTSAILILSAYDELAPLWKWQGATPGELTQAEQDTIEALVSKLYDEVTTPVVCEEVPAMYYMLGWIFPSALAAKPTGTLECNGATYLRVDYPDLYAVLNAAFIVDADHFIVPDLRGRVPVGRDGNLASPPLPAHNTGGMWGTPEETLTVAQMPAHHHAQRYHSSASGALAGLSALDTSSSTPTNMGTDTADTGGGLPHNNYQPSIALRFYIVALLP